MRQVRAASADRQADARLLKQFVASGDEAAFAALVECYGPMVLGVCRRLLRDRHDAEDAFQATFLLLVRKAGSLRRPALLGNWLYGVAYRTALKARASRARRAKEGCLAEVATVVPDNLVWRDLRPILDDAINELPSRYRVPVVLCYLQGLTQAQAAREIGCPEGTVATRLARARQRLRRRLAKHGLGVTAGAVGVGSQTSARLSALLLVSTVRIATAVRVGQTLETAGVPARVAALTKGVSKAMFLAKMRFVLGTVIVLTAIVGGTGVWTYGVLGSEPNAPEAPAVVQPPLVVPPATLIGVGVPPVAENHGAAAVVRTENFEVSGPTRRVAQLVADAAERCRKSEAMRWLGKELPAWSERCPVRVSLTDGGVGGATSFAYDQGKVTSRDMHLEGPLDRILSGCLPHEVTHTILADYFGGPLPRWADEGVAVMAEDEEEQQAHERLMWQLLDNQKRLIPLARLLRTKDFPKDVMCLYAEGYSLTRLLVDKKDRKTFLAFVAQGMKADGWDKAVKQHYGFDDVETLEEAWLAQEERAAAKKHAQAAEDKRAAITSSPPIVGTATIDKDGQIRVLTPVCYVKEITSYSKAGANIQVPVTSYEMQVGFNKQMLGAQDFLAVDLNGKQIDPKGLAKLLQTETPVLVSSDGKMVDPYYLKVVREGTVIIVPTIKEPALVEPPVRRGSVPDTEPKPPSH
jgi:RNA polymerase sigma factor (sigma-70 family)